MKRNDMEKAFIKVNLEDVVEYKFEYDQGTKLIYSTKIESIIYDPEGNIIAGDEDLEKYTSEVFIHKNGKVDTFNEDSDELIINSYIKTINGVLKSIDEHKANSYSHHQQLVQGGLDWDDIEYNEALWNQYLPLYNLLKNLNLSLELELIKEEALC